LGSRIETRGRAWGSGPLRFFPRGAGGGAGPGTTGFAPAVDIQPPGPKPRGPPGREFFSGKGGRQRKKTGGAAGSPAPKPDDQRGKGPGSPGPFAATGVGRAPGPGERGGPLGARRPPGNRIWRGKMEKNFAPGGPRPPAGEAESGAWGATFRAGGPGGGACGGAGEPRPSFPGAKKGGLGT